MRFVIFILAASLEYVFAAKILAVYPFPAKSHHNVYRPILVELANRGHHVTYITPIPVKNPPPTMKQIFIKNYLEDTIGKISLTDFGKLQTPLISHAMVEMGLFVSENVLQAKEIQSIIHSDEKYDAIMMESFFVQEPFVAFMHKFNAISIEVYPHPDSAWVNDQSGLADNPSYMIDFKSPYTDKMDYLERLHNAYITYATLLVRYIGQWRFQWQTDRYFNYTGWETRPPLRKLVPDKALILINSHYSVSYPYPRAPHVKEIGGINIVPNKPLPKDIEDFMNGATHGVIYFSFGSNLQMHSVVTSDLQVTLVNVFKKVNQRVLWKWENDDLPAVSKNVKLAKWFPQQDILAHKNMKMFITHGGILSIFEAVHNAVPLIAIPFFGDQDKNTRLLENVGCAIKMQVENITETSLSWAINEILNKPSYTKEVKRRSQMMRDRPKTPMEEAIFWIEFVLKYKNVLQPQSIHIPFYQLHNLEMLLPLFLIVMFILVVTLKMLKRIICCICKKSNKKPKDSMKKKN